MNKKLIYITALTVAVIFSAEACLWACPDKLRSARPAEKHQALRPLSCAERIENNFDSHCAGIYELFKKVDTDNAYATVSQVFQKHLMFLDIHHGIRIPAELSDVPFSAVSTEALNVMGILASRANSQRDIDV